MRLTPSVIAPSEGISSAGTFKGERIGELKTGGDAYNDFTLNCRKP
jgi:hypothetical protein